MIIREDLSNKYRFFRITDDILVGLNFWVSLKLGNSGCYFLLIILTALVYVVVAVLGISVYSALANATLQPLSQIILCLISLYVLVLLMLAVIPDNRRFCRS